MSTIAANNITDSTGSGAPNFTNGLKLNTNAVLGPVTGDAPMYACRAWVNFNGTGTVAIRASGNVSSITDNGTGDYTVNFTTAIPDANYAPNIQTNSNVTAFIGMFGGYQFTTDTKTASAYRFHTGFVDPASAGVGDFSDINVAIFR